MHRQTAARAPEMTGGNGHDQLGTQVEVRAGLRAQATVHIGHRSGVHRLAHPCPWWTQVKPGQGRSPARTCGATLPAAVAVEVPR